jgi:predicted phage terminase large subunit-like protein
MTSLPSGFNLQAHLQSLPHEEQVALLGLVQEHEVAVNRELAQDDFMHYMHEIWPGFVDGRHHQIMANAFERVAKGELKRLIINMGPRHTKSEMTSYGLPSWFLGKFPGKKVIQCSHTGDLAVNFGRKVRNLFDDIAYQAIFPGVKLRTDSRAAGRWNTNKNGDYFAVGVGGAVTGKGADLLIIDDPHSEQEGQSMNPEIFDAAYEWYTSGPRQRLQPDGAIIIVMTRWGKRDLTGRILEAAEMKDGVDQWEVIELPAIMPSGKPCWPEFWPIEQLLALRAELPTSKWMAQYQQDPTSEEGAILKRDWWKRWPHKEPPKCNFIIMSADTAYTKNSRSDYSAFTFWGVFEHPDEADGKTRNMLVLLNAFKDRMEFPELKKRATKAYQKWRPDSFIVEAKASGLPLIHELRKTGMPVQEFTPVRGNDKISRANAISDLFASGMVWAPETKWADDVITECAEFPNGSFDDYVDSVVMALLRYRQGGFVQLASDDAEAEETKKRKRITSYY